MKRAFFQLKAALWKAAFFIRACTHGKFQILFLVGGDSGAGGQRAGGQRAGGQRAGGQRAGGQRAGGQRAGGQRAGTRENEGGRWAGSGRRRGGRRESCEGGRREKNEGHLSFLMIFYSLFKQTIKIRAKQYWLVAILTGIKLYRQWWQSSEAFFSLFLSINGIRR